MRLEHASCLSAVKSTKREPIGRSTWQPFKCIEIDGSLSGARGSILLR